MVKKHCLKTSDDGECLKWEKTFDLGKRAAFEKHVVNFDQEALDYLDVFNNDYEKNTEFGQAISTLAAFSDMKAFDDGTKAFDPKLVFLFSGEEKKCRRSLNSKNLFDCCYKETDAGRGVFTHLGDLGGNCSKEEKDLYLAVSEGRCKKVGKIPQLLETKHVYCCFPTKLSKIVQEAGRKQLGLSFGSPENPECKGLSTEQIGKIDFERIDFTEFIEEIQEKINQKELVKRFKNLAEDFAKKTTSKSAKQKTSSVLEAQDKRLKDLGKTIPDGKHDD